MVARSSDGDSPRELVRALVDAWNRKDVDEILAFFHDDFENWQAPLGTVRGLEAYRAHLGAWFRAFPDLRLEIVTLFSEGERVCLETVATGRPQGGFFGVDPRPGAENRALDVLELRDGKVWRQRGYWDFSLWTGERSPLAAAARGGDERSPEALAYAWRDALRGRDADGFGRLFAEDAVMVDVEHRTDDLRDARALRGRAAIVRQARLWFDETPAFEYDVLAAVADEARVAARWRYALAPPGGGRLALEGVTWLACADGEIREALVLFDSHRLLRELGRA